MALNLKNPDTLAAIDELARLTGLSKSEAVASAVEQRLEALLAETARPTMTDQDRLARVLELARDTGQRLRAAQDDEGPANAQALVDALYDEDGLYA